MESPPPLYVSLGTKANFHRRLANLNTGALEGKGLSELATWIERSESPLGHTEIDSDDDKQGENPVPENDEADEHYGNASDRTNGEEIAASKVDSSVQPPDNPNQLLQSEEVQESTATASPDIANGLLVTPQISASDAPTLSATQISKSGEYDEEDLIDYSDEELEDQGNEQNTGSGPAERETDDGSTHNGTFTDFIPPCVNPNTCFCSKCNGLLLAEYEAISEDLRRRPISRPDEDDDVEHSAEGIENSQDVHSSHAKTNTGVGYDEDENDGGNFGDDFDGDELNGASSDENGATYDGIAGAEEQDDNHFDLDDDEAPEEERPTSDVKHDPGVEDDTSGYANHDDAFVEEVDAGEGDVNQSLNSSGPGGGDAVLGNASSTSNNVEFADVAEGGTTASANENQHEDGIRKHAVDDFKDSIEPHTLKPIAHDAEHEDEIDYDDDDDEQKPPVTQDTVPKAENTNVTNGGTGKRPRAEDADLDQGMTTRSKGM